MEFLDYIWLGVMILAAIAEAMGPALVSVWFVPGGLAALIVSLCGGPLWLQLLLFFAVSGTALLLTRPLVRKIQSRKKIRTNADRVLGSIAVVTQEINNLLGTGRAEVMGNSWSARSSGLEEAIPVGERVIVERIEGVKLIVRKETES